MNRDEIESYTGERVRLTMIDDATFEGLLWFVEFEDERELEVASIALDTYGFQFKMEHIKNIEILKEDKPLPN